MNQKVELISGIDNALLERYSPKSFSDKKINEETLNRMFLAATTVSSCYNEQPWRFVVAKKGTPLFEKILSLLMEGNQTWAQNASVLTLNLIKKTFSHNGGVNFHAMHDLGLAVQALTQQAHIDGIGVHQMGGIHFDKIYDMFGFDNDLQLVSAMALGYYSTKDFTKAIESKQSRKSLSDILINI